MIKTITFPITLLRWWSAAFAIGHIHPASPDYLDAWHAERELREKLDAN